MTGQHDLHTLEVSRLLAMHFMDGAWNR